jgi:hypothetical protein
MNLHYYERELELLTASGIRSIGRQKLTDCEATDSMLQHTGYAVYRAQLPVSELRDDADLARLLEASQQHIW